MEWTRILVHQYRSQVHPVTTIDEEARAACGVHCEGSRWSSEVPVIGLWRATLLLLACTVLGVSMSLLVWPCFSGTDHWECGRRNGFGSIHSS
jgi:hypothetical protein